MRGIIEKIEATSGERDGKPWQRWTITVEGKKYSTFDHKMGPMLKAGETYDLEVEQKGSYWNLLTATPVSSELKPPKPKAEQRNGPGSGRDAAIERMHREKTRAACLEAASRVLSTNALVEKKPADPGAILELAEKYFEWAESE